jgi:hypothetical protein
MMREFRDDKMEQPAERGENPPAPPAGDAPRMNYLPQIESMMKSAKRRGNPKDFVILAHHGIVYDHDRQWQVRAQLPKKLEPGWHVYTFDKDGQLAPMRVVRDEGENVWLTAGEGFSEHKVPRSECYPTGIPRTPKLVHKSRLISYIGARYAGLFWHQSLGRRVTNPGKAKAH